MDETLKQRIIGEAKFIRAYNCCHWSTSLERYP